MMITARRCRSGTFAWFCGVIFTLAGCGDEQAPRQPTSEAAPSSASEKTGEWLDHKANISPAQWLASRGEASVRPETDERVKLIERDLSRAHAIFRESQRMIANRAVQLESMLRELGSTEDAASILADIMSIPGEVGQTEGFGAVTQHYYILRSNKTERVAALALLKERYGPRESGEGAAP